MSNVDLRKTIEEKAAHLLEDEGRAYPRGKNFTQAGDKQQRRHLTQIQLVVSFVFITATDNFATTGKLTGKFN